jgi:hypothetical protein
MAARHTLLGHGSVTSTITAGDMLVAESLNALRVAERTLIVRVGLAVGAVLKADLHHRGRIEQVDRRRDRGLQQLSQAKP